MSVPGVVCNLAGLAVPVLMLVAIWTGDERWVLTAVVALFVSFSAWVSQK